MAQGGGGCAATGAQDAIGKRHGRVNVAVVDAVDMFVGQEVAVGGDTGDDGGCATAERLEGVLPKVSTQFPMQRVRVAKL